MDKSSFELKRGIENNIEILSKSAEGYSITGI